MLTLKIEKDEYYEESPREWDNLGTMVCWHKRYTLGDSHSYATWQQWLLSLVENACNRETIKGWRFDELWEYARYNNIPNPDVSGDYMLNVLNDLFDRYVIALPLYLYDHSGITMNTSGFSCSWDSGQVGYIYVTKEDVLKEFSWKRLTKKRIEKIQKILRGEVEIYDQYLRGDIWSYIIEDDETGELLDSDRGIFGYEWAEKEGKHALEILENDKEV